METFFALPYVKYTAISIAALIVAFLISKILRILLDRFIRVSSKKMRIDATQFSFLKNAVTFFIFLGALIFIFYTIPALKSLGITLFAGAGILTAIALFASQQAFANIVSGVFIVIFKPFRVNDIVDIGTLPKGRIEDITLRHTVIRDFENRRMIITNSSIVDDAIRNFFEIGISYDSDINRAMEIIKEEAVKHPNFIDKRTNEEKKDNVHPVLTRVIGMGDSSVNIRAYIWTQDHESGFVLKTDLYKSVKERFDNEGVEIPFPYRTIVYKKDI